MSEVDVYDRLISRGDIWSKQKTKPNVEGQYTYITIRKTLTRKDIDDSLLTKNKTIGTYTISATGDTVVNPGVDIDNHDGKKEVIEKVKTVFNAFTDAGWSPYIEASAGLLKDGSHVNLICQPTDAKSVRDRIKAVLASVGLEKEIKEINPKQDMIGVDPKTGKEDKTKIGNLVKLPWQFNNRTGQRSQIINPETFEPFERQDAIRYMMELPDTVFASDEDLAADREARVSELNQKIYADAAEVVPIETKNKNEEWLNDRGMTLEEVRTQDAKLNKLLMGANEGVGHRSEACFAATNLLKDWGFSDDATKAILRQYRPYEKTERDDYLETTVGKVKKVCGDCLFKPHFKVGFCKHDLHVMDGKEPIKTNHVTGEPCKDFVTAESPAEKKKKARAGLEEADIIDVAGKVIEKHPIFTMVDNPDEMYYYDSGVYKKGAQTKIRAVAQEILGEETSRFNIAEIIFYIQNKTFIERIEINREKYIINLKNGLYNVKEKTFGSHTPTTLSTCQIPTEYKPDATCPKISKFLCEILKPRDIATILQEIGYSLIPDYTIQKAFLWDGSGLNGKGTLGRLITSLIGALNKSSASLGNIKQTGLKLHF